MVAKEPHPSDFIRTIIGGINGRKNHRHRDPQRIEQNEHRHDFVLYARIGSGRIGQKNHIEIRWI